MTETGTAGIVSGGHGRTFFSPPQAPSDFQLQGFVNFGDMFCKDFLRPVAGGGKTFPIDNLQENRSGPVDFVYIKGYGTESSVVQVVLA